ncbi:MAG: ABC transporter permease [Pseudolysinimonas sp.]
MTSSAASQPPDRAQRLATLPMEKTSAKIPFFASGLPTLREIWRRRELVGLLVRRELRARYKGSSLGILWSLIKPLAQLLVYYFAIGQILGAARSIPSFAIFVFIGLTTWTLATEILTSGTRSIVDNAGLVKKVTLPREIFPLAAVGGALVNLGIQFIVLVVAMIAVGEFPLNWGALWVIPSLLLVVTFSSAIAVLLAALNVYLRDIQHLVEVVLIVAFWTSPIVYAYSFVSNLSLGWVLDAYLLNPITLGVLGMQRALWVAGAGIPGSFPTHLGLRIVIAFLISAVLLWISHRIFQKLQGNFAQEL